MVSEAPTLMHQLQLLLQNWHSVRTDGCSASACRGLPLHEAMAMGLPTISTDWGGNTQFMLPRNSYLIQ